MNRPTLEVADLIRACGDRFVEQNQRWLGFQQVKVLHAVEGAEFRRSAVMLIPADFGILKCQQMRFAGAKTTCQKQRRAAVYFGSQNAGGKRLITPSAAGDWLTVFGKIMECCMRCLFCSYVTFAALGCAYAQNDVLAPGNPPLTATMVDQRIWVVETFLNIHLTPDQRDRFSRALADDWRTRDKQQIEYTLSDLKYYGKDADLKKMAATGLDAYVDNLRNHPDDPLNSVLLEAFDAAHPDRKDVMRPRGLGHLLGKWGGGDAMVGDRDPFTGRAMGVSFTDGLTLTIFSDGRFVHGWAHRHCSGAACCQEYGTMASGTIEVEGTTLTLNAESGLRMSRGNCVPMNVSERMSPKREVFQYSMRVQKPQNVPLLCLSSHPFQFNEKVAAQPSAMRRSEPLNSCPA